MGVTLRVVGARVCVCDGEVINGEGSVRVSVNPHIRITCKRTHGVQITALDQHDNAHADSGVTRIDRWLDAHDFHPHTHAHSH